MRVLVLLFSSVLFLYNTFGKEQIKNDPLLQEELEYEVEADRFFYDNLNCELISIRIISIAPNGQRLLAATGVWNYKCDQVLFSNYIDANDSYLKECGEITLLDKQFLGFKMIAENYEGACILDLLEDETHGDDIEKHIKLALEEMRKG